MFQNVSYVKSIKFRVYSEEKKNQMCVKKITNSNTCDELGIATIGGLSDQSMGTSDSKEICTTCSLNGLECPGHLGVIHFVLPVYNPMFFDTLITILQGSCFICHQSYINKYKIYKFIKEFQLISYGLISEAYQLDCNYTNWITKLTTKSLTSSQKDDIIIHKIKKYSNNFIKNYHHHYDYTKFIEDQKSAYIASFIKNIYLDKSLKYCSNCNLPKTHIKREFIPMISVKFSKSKSHHFENIDINLLKLSSIKLDADSLLLIQHLTSLDVFKHFDTFGRNNQKFLNILFGRKKKECINDLFFINSLCVIPPKYRPVSVLGDNKYENATTFVYKRIITSSQLLENELKSLNNVDSNIQNNNEVKISKKLSNSNRITNKYEKLHSLWSELQTNINILYDKNLSTNTKEECIGIKQLLEKKEGLFRMHMMGKRVNYSARSVISPDPMIDIDQVGVPQLFATKLTYPEIITTQNESHLISLLSNGPLIHPGACQVMINDTKYVLQSKNKAKNLALSKKILLKENNIVEVKRHLVNDDLVLMNRQPSLHRPSIMGHRVRVLPEGQTIRLHYANCKSYNADFDGDEMNMHLPQTELGRAEVSILASCVNHYLSPKDGKPLTGLIQDYLVSSVLLTIKDRFLDENQYQKIIFSAFIDIDRTIVILKPAIYKPQKLWTGKQLISTLIINCTPVGKYLLNMRGKSKINDKLWSSSFNNDILNEMTDDIIIIRNGELLRGIFDKNQFGSSPYGIIHYFYELYGGKYSNRLLSVVGRACISLLKYIGFSMGIEDIVLEKEAMKLRNKIILKSRNIDKELLEMIFPNSANTHVFNNKSGINNSQNGINDVNGDINNIKSDINDSGNELKINLKKAYMIKNENIYNKVEQCGKIKSSEYQNKMNEVCSKNKLIKKFPLNSLQLMIESGAKGTSVNAMQMSVCLGQIELEGKRPPIMISRRTLPCFEELNCSLQGGGFVESSFINGLNSFEYFFHCMAGREGLIDTAVKTSRIGYLQRCMIKNLEGVMSTYDHSARDSDGSIIQFLYGEDGCDTTSLQFALDSKFEIFSMNSKHAKCSLQLDKAEKYINTSYIKSNNKEEKNKKSKSRIVNNEAYVYKNSTKLPNISLNPPSHYLGCVSEKYKNKLDQFINDEKGKSIISNNKRKKYKWQTNKEEFEKLMLLKYIRCLITPGESVGILAAQSVGEPSTQMTLNTFHFAGRADVNVTLGIPRLREIFMTGGENIKTPSITISAHEDISLERLKELSIRLTPIALVNFIQSINFESKYTQVLSQRVFKNKVEIQFNFKDKLKVSQYGIDIEEVVNFIKLQFIRKFIILVSKRSTNLSTINITKDTSSDLNNSSNTNDDSNDNGGNSDGNDNDNNSDGDDSENESKTNISYDDNNFYFNKDLNICKFNIKLNVTNYRTNFIAILKKLIEKTYINEIPNIKRCIIIDNNKLHIEGNNISSLLQYSHIVNLHTLYSNNIQITARYLGIEAARMVIVKEIEKVFEVYGIIVNYRHLTLLADYMTFHGNYRACNRVGIQSNPSAFQKMSFETTVKFLKNACTYSQPELLKSPSARLVSGIPLNIGTGAFQLLYKST